MGLPYWVAIWDFHPSASTSPKVGNVDAFARDGAHSLRNTYQDNCPKGQIERMPRSGAITTFVILTPLKWGTETARKKPKVGSIPFVLVSKIDV